MVVCPAEFRPTLHAWEEYRRGQGHEIAIVEPPDSAADLQATIRRVGGTGRLKYVVLIGDVPARGPETRAQQAAMDGATNGKFAIPTHYVTAKIKELKKELF